MYTMRRLGLLLLSSYSSPQNMSALRQLLQVVCDTLVFWGTFLYFSLWQQPISKLEVFGKERLPVCHVYTLAKTLQLWDAPHYRVASFAEDLRANLRNVAIPGTGIPLSVFCYSKATALFFILVVNPLISLAAAVYLACHKPGDGAQQQQQAASVAATYRRLLLFPDHWFAVWRHNCMLVGYHALLTGSSSYEMESKGTWLLEGQRLGLPVSPFYSEGAVFVKHVSIEGGMGIHVFRNFAQGGDFVIQRALHNSASLSRMLPPGAPLSTLRVVTASTAWLDQQQQEGRTSTNGRQLGRTTSGSSSGQLAGQGAGAGLTHGSQPGGRLTPELPLSAGVVQQQQQQQRSPTDDSTRHQRICSSSNGSLSQADTAEAGGAVQQQQWCSSSSSGDLYGGQVRVVTAVWRAGLAGKDTDHSSICFPLDPQTGVLSAGRTSNHWYKLGVLKWLGRVPAEAGRTWLTHPDCGAAVAGATIPDVQRVMRTVMHAHMVATPDVPLVGWDVALTPEGVYLLEMNLSCNLFSGPISGAYYENMYQHLEALEELEELGKQQQQQFQKRR